MPEHRRQVPRFGHGGQKRWRLTRVDVPETWWRKFPANRVGGENISVLCYVHSKTWSEFGYTYCKQVVESVRTAGVKGGANSVPVMPKTTVASAG